MLEFESIDGNDLSRLVNGEKIEYAVDVKGIRPNAKKKPAHKPTLSKVYERKSYHIRDQILKRI